MVIVTIKIDILELVVQCSFPASLVSNCLAQGKGLARRIRNGMELWPHVKMEIPTVPF